MIWATEYKHVDLVKLLLSKGSDINIRDNVSLPREADPGGLGTGVLGGSVLAPACGSDLFPLSRQPCVDPVRFPVVILCVSQLLDVNRGAQFPETCPSGRAAFLEVFRDTGSHVCGDVRGPRAHPTPGPRSGDSPVPLGTAPCCVSVELFGHRQHQAHLMNSKGNFSGGLQGPTAPGRW